MTIEQYKKSKQYESIFRNALNFDFIHLTYSEFEKISDLFTEIYGKSLTKSQKNCNTCRLKAIKDLGKDYFKYANEYDKIIEAEEKAVTEKPKRGRPKKIDLDKTE